MRSYRFFAPPENFNLEGIALDAEETRHLRDVLRLREGNEIYVFDGKGREFLCRIAKISKKNSELTILKENGPAAPESPLEMTIAAGILKGEKFDLVIQKAVELGVTAFVPLLTARCDVKLKDTAKRLGRWKKIIIEASKQSGRARLMDILEPVDFPAFLEKSGFEDIVMFSERGGANFESIGKCKKKTALVGPEGGWDNSELELAKSNKIAVVTLGGRILRAETAAISVASILQHRFGDFN